MNACGHLSGWALGALPQIHNVIHRSASNVVHKKIESKDLNFLQTQSHTITECIVKMFGLPAQKHRVPNVPNRLNVHAVPGGPITWGSRALLTRRRGPLTKTLIVCRYEVEEKHASMLPDPPNTSQAFGNCQCQQQNTSNWRRHLGY